MPRCRVRGEQCPRCKLSVNVMVDLDMRAVMQAHVPMGCIGDPIKCIENVRDKALLAPFEDGKTRKGH